LSRVIFPAGENGVEVIELSRSEGRALFDKACREELGISGDEFLHRLDAGEYPDCGCCPEGVFQLRMIEPFGR
jgi:hypothetical protein